MNKFLYPAAAVLIMLASAFTVINSQNWKIGKDYSIQFTTDDASGVFKEMTGSIQFDPNNLGASKMEVAVAVNSINTGNGMKNTHAKSDKWFDAEKYPNIKYTSTEITKTAAGYSAKGTMEMHGVKKDFTIPFTFKETPAGSIFTGGFDISRKDYGMTNTGTGKIADVLKVDISVPVTK